MVPNISSASGIAPSVRNDVASADLEKLSSHAAVRTQTPGSPAKGLRIAQAESNSAVLAKSQVLTLNPKWDGRANRSESDATTQIELTGQSLAESGLIQQKAGAFVLMKPLSLASGVLIPAGSKVSGAGLPGDGKPVNQSNQIGGPAQLSFELPNGSSITFKAAQEKTSGLGATTLEIFDRKTGVTVRTQLVASLFMDTKNESLSFLGARIDGRFRINDLRGQVANSESWRAKAIERETTNPSGSGRSLSSAYAQTVQVQVGLSMIGAGDL